MNKQPKITINSFPYRNNNLGIKACNGERARSLLEVLLQQIDSDGVNQQKRLAKSLLRYTDIKYIIKTTERIYNGDELNGFIEIYQLHAESMILQNSPDQLQTLISTSQGVTRRISLIFIKKDGIYPLRILKILFMGFLNYLLKLALN
jgi:hypothetical protein